MPKVSIVIPIYNVERFLSTCINSLISQSYDKIEIILVDDGSTDKSASICDNFLLKDSRIIVIHKSNGGEGDARNEGLKRATGEWVCFVDSDDYVSVNYIEKLVNSIQGVQLVMSGFDKVFPDHCDVIRMEPQTITCTKNTDLITKYKLNEYGFVAGKLYNMGIINRYKIQFAKIKLKADQLFLFQYISKIDSIRITDGHGYKYRQVEGSMSHLKFDFNLSLSRKMEFYEELKLDDMIDKKTKQLLLYNFLDGPIGVLYTSPKSRKDRIKCLKLIDKNVYRETKIIKSWKERVLCYLLVSRMYYLFDWHMNNNHKSVK